MITEEEREITERIQKVGREKYAAALNVLADTLGIGIDPDPEKHEYTVKKGVEEMLLWARNNFHIRRKEFEDAGLYISIDCTNDHGHVRRLDVDDRDIGNWRVEYQSINDGNQLILWGSSWKNLLHLGGRHTADSAMNIVSNALKCLSRWQSMAAKYNVLKGTCAEAYRNDSLARAEKARHQLELLEKL